MGGQVGQGLGRLVGLREVRRVVTGPKPAGEASGLGGNLGLGMESVRPLAQSRRGVCLWAGPNERRGGTGGTCRKTLNLWMVRRGNRKRGGSWNRGQQLGHGIGTGSGRVTGKGLGLWWEQSGVQAWGPSREGGAWVRCLTPRSRLDSDCQGGRDVYGGVACTNNWRRSVCQACTKEPVLSMGRGGALVRGRNIAEMWPIPGTGAE